MKITVEIPDDLIARALPAYNVTNPEGIVAEMTRQIQAKVCDYEATRDGQAAADAARHKAEADFAVVTVGANPLGGVR